MFFADINECDSLYGACSQICENTIGSFLCSCVDGFKASPIDSKKCIVATGKLGILFIHQLDIRLLDITSNDSKILVDHSKAAIDLVSFHFFDDSNTLTFLGLPLSKEACILEG